jgi:hypothetical protein
MNKSQKTSGGNEPQFSYRNTRSKFYKSKSSEFDADGEFNQGHSIEKNTGNYWKEQGNA